MIKHKHRWANAPSNDDRLGYRICHTCGEEQARFSEIAEDGELKAGKWMPLPDPPKD